jgi:O-antigen/teichoic acid export membrane protein
VLYTEGRVRAALVTDVVAYGGQALLILALWYYDRLNTSSAVWVIAVTSCAGVFVGFRLLRVSLTTNVSRVDLVAHWKFGKWLAAAAIGFGLSAYLYFYITAVALGAAASGDLKASQLVLGPLNILLLFLVTVLPIRLSRALKSSGEAGLRRTLVHAVTLATPVVVVYCLLAAGFAEPMLRAIYGGQHPGSAELVALFALYCVLTYVGQMATSVLNARQFTRPIGVANFAGAGSTIVLGWLFIKAAGVNGAALGMILGVALLDLTLFLYLLRAAGRLRSERAEIRRHPLGEAHAIEGLGALDESAAIPGFVSDATNRSL